MKDKCEIANPQTPNPELRSLGDAFLLVAIAGLVALLAGCSTYQLQGKAVPGAASAIFVVDADDPRLQRPGLAGAQVSMILDPQRLSAKHGGSAVTDLAGQFAIPVDAVGAGLLEYDAQVTARLSGHRGVLEQFMLPSPDKRVLIVLEQGASTAPPRGESFLDETLRLGKPYMN